MNNETTSSHEEENAGISDRPSEVLAESLVDKEPTLIDADFEFAKSLVEEAGELVRTGLGSTFETQWRPDNTPVTSIDLAVKLGYSTPLTVPKQ